MKNLWIEFDLYNERTCRNEPRVLYHKRYMDRQAGTYIYIYMHGLLLFLSDLNITSSDEE